MDNTKECVSIRARATDYYTNGINGLQAVFSESKTASDTKKIKDAPVAQLDRATDF
jgi:hypothetical protein